MPTIFWDVAGQLTQAHPTWADHLSDEQVEAALHDGLIFTARVERVRRKISTGRNLAAAACAGTPSRWFGPSRVAESGELVQQWRTLKDTLGDMHRDTILAGNWAAIGQGVSGLQDESWLPVLQQAEPLLRAAGISGRDALGLNLAAQGFRQLATDDLLAISTLRKALSFMSDQLTIHPDDILLVAEGIAQTSRRIRPALREPATLH